MIHYPSQPNIEDGTPEIEVTQPNNEVSIDNYFDSSFQNSFENENAEVEPAGKRRMKTSLLREREASAPMLQTDFRYSRAESDEFKMTPEPKDRSGQ